MDAYCNAYFIDLANESMPAKSALLTFPGGLLAKKKSCVLSSALIRRRCFATADSRNKIDNDIVEMNGECDPVLRSPPRDNLGFVGGRELLWGLKWKLDFDNLRNEVGRPASELSPYRQTSLVMPSIEDVDRAVNTIREEERKLVSVIMWNWLTQFLRQLEGIRTPMGKNWDSNGKELGLEWERIETRMEKSWDSYRMNLGERNEYFRV